MNLILVKRVRKRSQRQEVSILLRDNLKKATELYGLTFGNELDKLLGSGLQTNTLTYLYGKNVSWLLNILALNSVGHFGGRVMFVDAGNSADPYLIRKEADLREKDSTATRGLLRSIELTRVFTCHQLTNFVTEQLPKLLSKNVESENPIRFVGVGGLDSVFSEEDSSKSEIARLQYLIARKLRDISKSKENRVMFVVASSKEQCSHFLKYCDVAIEIYSDRRSRRDRAALIRHPFRRGQELEIQLSRRSK
jgi:hypothetical protein